MGIGKTIKNILSDKDANGADSTSSPTRPTAAGGAANQRHVDSVDVGSGEGATSPIIPSRGTEGTKDPMGLGQKTGGFTDHHTHGHHDKDLQPSAGQSHQEDLHRLNPVTHEHVRHQEVEEVVRQKEKDRHVHHVQHHTVPVVQREEKDEVHHEKIHPVTKVHERHANSKDDAVRLDRQIHGQHDHVHHGEKERTVIDKGTVVNENVHHHTHHVIQPIIEKETFDKHRVHTVIPLHEEVHEAPIVHESQKHAPISVQDFLNTFGGDSVTSGAVPHNQIGNKVMHPPDCERTVDGVGEKLARELHLGVAEPSDVEHTDVGERNVPGRFALGTTEDSDGVGMHKPQSRSTSQDSSVRQEEKVGSHGRHDPQRGMGHYNIGKSASDNSTSARGGKLTGYEDQRAVGTKVS